MSAQGQLASQSPLVRVPCPLCDGGRTRYERAIRGYALERCLGCGMVFVNPRCAQDNLLEQYEQREPRAQIEFWGRATTPYVLADFDRILGRLEALVPGGGRLLDFGCGACYFLECALTRGWDGYGVDVAPWVQEAARARGVGKLFLGPLAEQKFADATFGVVYSNQVFEHLAQPRVVLAEIHRLLRPGGVLYVNVPNYRRLPVMLGCDDFKLDTPMGHVNYFTPRTMGKMLRQCGFDVLHTSTYGGLKLENLFGKPTRSDIVDALTRPIPAAPARLSVVKRVLSPFVKGLAYKFAKLGMTLEVFARRP